jgi:hypothetical protein
MAAIPMALLEVIYVSSESLPCQEQLPEKGCVGWAVTFSQPRNIKKLVRKLVCVINEVHSRPAASQCP